MSYFEAIGIVKDFTGERQASDDLLGDDEDPLEHFLLWCCAAVKSHTD